MTGSLGMARARRAVRLLVGLAVAVPPGIAGLGVAAVGTARAASAINSPVTFTYTGAEQTYAVPSWATALVITAVGAPGNSASTQLAVLAGGDGGSVTATVPVTALPAHTGTLYVEVGGPGASYSDRSCSNAGGFNGGGEACLGTGGGASDVRTTSIATVPDSALTAANDSRLVVAGGGGGGGFGAFKKYLYCYGGRAGDTTVDGPGSGGDGTGNLTCAGGNGGFLGIQGGGGGGGGGDSGARGEGGAGVGGGGGGYYGGGGGGGGLFDGGGGAGSSFWVRAAIDTSMSEDSTGVPQVTITPIASWAGYVMTGPDGTFTSVSASWTQPGVPCGVTSEAGYSRFWVGLDGYSRAPVQQVGTQADCRRNGGQATPIYSGWWRVSPAAAVGFPGVIRPGDQITASVTLSGTQTYTLVLHDATRNWTDTAVETGTGVGGSSAEVITEDPEIIGGLEPLANFGTVNFLTSSVNGTSLGAQHPARLLMINGGQEDVTASPISSAGAFHSTGITLGGTCTSLSCQKPTWAPAQYGSSRVGSTDSCLAAFTGAASVSYAWQADGTAIKGARSATYQIPASLAGDTLTCSVTASTAYGSTSGSSSGAIVSPASSGSPAAAAQAAATGVPMVWHAPHPALRWMPVLYGTAQVGRTVSCQAAFDGEDSVTYAWLADGAPITGATASSYKIPASLHGQTLACSVVAANLAGSLMRASAAVTVALGRALVPVVKPTLSGPHQPGKTETVTAGKWSPVASMVTYQWYLGSGKVKGATKSTFTVPKSAKKGTTVHCVISASTAGYATGSYTTPAVKIT